MNNKNLYSCVILSYVFLILVPAGQSIEALDNVQCETSHVLNDCNWCQCLGKRYVCQPRDCGQVDMFGHFNDDIQTISMGMEGHGAWRSGDTACQPGVQYIREDVLCICSEEGSWPNPVCRDIFRVLRPVEVSGKNYIDEGKACFPNKLYTVGCNICFCPSNGRFDPAACTKKTCYINDPLLQKSKTNQLEPRETFNEVYAVCQLSIKYKLGCQSCFCLRNNILICDRCARDKPISSQSQQHTVKSELCKDKRRDEIFRVDCNLCFCDRYGIVMCSIKHCLVGGRKTSIERELQQNGKFVMGKETMSDAQSCTPGTAYRVKCNNCYCYLTRDGVKVYSCTLRQCGQMNKMDYIKTDCAEGTTYEKDCQICSCHVAEYTKYERCKESSRCKAVSRSGANTKLSDLRGYCEPLRVYKKACNTCRCLPNGKLVSCTDYACNTDVEREGLAKVLPVVTSYNEKCPPGHVYRLACNYCFCFSDGNAVCTLMDCNPK